MDTSEEAKQWFARYKKAKAKKTKWLDIWQYVGKYIHTRKQNFTEFTDEGTFLNEDVFDSTAPKANRKMSAALMGLLWQSGGESIRIHPADGIEKSTETKEYFSTISNRIAKALDDPRAGLTLALEEYMNDQGCFGTSGVGCFEGEESLLRFQAWGVDEISIEEGENGFVRTIFREFTIPVSRAVEEYGLENLSDAVKDLHKEADMSEMVKFLHIITPNKEKEGKPYKSLHFEYVPKSKVKDDGFFEMPVAVARFYKKRNEIYGRSPGMEALPDILEINATKEARISAIEKSLDPPLGVYDDSVLGNEEIDTSAGGINVFATSGRMANRNPIFPLFTVETIREADKSIEDLIRSINEHFNIDVLLDFNNETRMTLGETQIRQRIRSEALGSLISRQQNELYTPTVERSVNVLYRQGELGVIKDSPEEAIVIGKKEEPFYIPESVAKFILAGKDFYEIEYITPAARMMETAEAQGVLRTWEFAAFAAEFAPDVLDNLNADESLKIISRSEGAPDRILLSDEQVITMRKAKIEQMKQQAELQKQREETAAIKEAGDAGKAIGEGFPDGSPDGSQGL